MVYLVIIYLVITDRVGLWFILSLLYSLIDQVYDISCHSFFTDCTDFGFFFCYNPFTNWAGLKFLLLFFCHYCIYWLRNFIMYLAFMYSLIEQVWDLSSHYCIPWLSRFIIYLAFMYSLIEQVYYISRLYVFTDWAGSWFI